VRWRCSYFNTGQKSRERISAELTTNAAKHATEEDLAQGTAPSVSVLWKQGIALEKAADSACFFAL
jgi:hypothetical protein